MSATAAEVRRVLCYAVFPRYNGPHYEDDFINRVTIIRAPSYFHHCWIAEHLQYGEEALEHGTVPPLEFVTLSGYEVFIKGPREYTIRRK